MPSRALSAPKELLIHQPRHMNSNSGWDCHPQLAQKPLNSYNRQQFPDLPPQPRSLQFVHSFLLLSQLSFLKTCVPFDRSKTIYFYLCTGMERQTKHFRVQLAIDVYSPVLTRAYVLHKNLQRHIPLVRFLASIQDRRQSSPSRSRWVAQPTSFLSLYSPSVF